MKISGFKSFVDPVTIELPSQLIGIVGPNGCGKSNIIDAVRWVLGESSAKNLRGDAMTDVIFNGASTRRAVGQASVELRFDNQLGKLGGEFNQYQEISIKRTVNRDGDSAYFLNGKRCRKRDITDIFLGTGAGSRGYSIISQGTISQLIEAKPLTLRAYLEEAAGISRYKERRRETLQRIEHTKANLARLQDISLELEKQIARLQRQARTAERYQQLKQDELQCRIKIAAFKWQQHRSLKEQLQQQLEEIVEGINELKRKRASLINELSQAQTHLQTQQLDYQQKQQTFYEQQSELARIEEQALMREKERQALLNQVKQAQQDWEQISRTLADEKEKLITNQQKIRQSEELLADISQQYEKAKIELEDIETHQQQNAKEHHFLSSQKQTLSHEQQLLQLKLDQLTDKQQQWMTQLDNTDGKELANTIHESQGIINELEEDLKKQESNIEQIQAIIQSLQAEEKGQQLTLSQLKEAVQETEKLYQDTLRKKTIVDASIEANSLHTEASKPLFLEGQMPIFHNITVPPEWQSSFQWIASQLLQGYLIEDTNELVQYQSQLHQCGLEFCQTNKHYQSTDKQTLADIVTGPIPDTNLKLESISLADSFEQAYAERNSLTNNESFLTKDGYWLGKTWLRCRPNESEHAVNLLALAQDQKQLSQTLSDLSDKLSNLTSKQQLCENTLKDNIEAIKRTQTELNDLQKVLQQTQTQLTLRQNNLSQAEKEKIRLDELSQLCQSELESIASERITLESKKQLKLEELERVEQKLLQFDNLKQQTDAVNQQKEQTTNLHEQLQQYQLLIQQLRQFEQNAKQQLDYWQSQQDKVSARLNELKTSLSSIDEHSEDRDASHITAIKDEHSKRKHQLDKLQSELEAEKKIIQTHLQQTDALQQQTIDMEHSFQTIQLKAQEASIRLEDAHNQLDSYQVTINDAMSLLSSDDNLERLNQLLDQLNNRVQQLGAVNLAAKAELDEEMARKQELDRQQADLNEAIDTLNQAINKIDQETKSRFSETFEQVNQTFQHLFPTVFGGGKALLKLEGDDWLDSGVLVMAQPPGKRNSTIQLLSGGEKALTAVALVFALFQLNPSPFCLLDEVDAPLDDANVGRFCQLVEKMSEHVQFLIITHNKVTMTLANHLIGVTMKEPGVSRLVAVDVAEALEMSNR